MVLVLNIKLVNKHLNFKLFILFYVFRCEYPQSQTCPDGFEKIEITPTKFRCEGTCLAVCTETNKIKTCLLDLR